MTGYYRIKKGYTNGKNLFIDQWYALDYKEFSCVRIDRLYNLFKQIYYYINILVVLIYWARS